MNSAVWGQLLGVFLWGTLVLYGSSSLWWLLQVVLLSYGWQDTDQTAVGLDKIQVRIPTVAAEETVQLTLNTITAAPSGTRTTRSIRPAF